MCEILEYFVADVALTERFFGEVAGWMAMKESGSLLAGGYMLNESWKPPKIEGAVWTEAGLLRAGLIIKSRANVENLCPCRQSRQWGTMCTHSIGVSCGYCNRKRKMRQEVEGKGSFSGGRRCG